MLYRITILVLLFTLPLFMPSAQAVVATPTDNAPTAKENTRKKPKLREVFKMMRILKKHKKSAPNSTQMDAEGPKKIMLAGMSGMLIGGILLILGIMAFQSLILTIAGGIIAGVGLLALLAGIILHIIGKKK